MTMVAKKNESQSILDETRDLFDPNLDPDRFDGIHLVTTREEAWELFDQDARLQLGVSGEEFLRRWDSGEYRDIQDDREGRKVMRVAFLIPTVRATDG
jgi:hypothetical protein